MKAVIMAGGKGTRLRPLTLNTPKPMVPLLNRPCMTYIIELLKRYDIHQIAVTVQYMPDVIRNYYGDGSEFGVKLTYFEEDAPLGTAGSIKNAESFLDESFIVISGDALTDFNLRQAIDYHRQKKAIATMVLAQVDNPLEYGVVMTAPDGRVTRFLEKPSWSEVFSDTVNTGIYIFEPSILNRIPAGKTYDFSLDVFPELLAQQEPLYGYAAQGYWSDIGNLFQYRQSQFDMLDRKVHVDIKATEPMPGLFVESGVRLPSRIRLSGPAYIGSGCTLHPSCSIGPYTVLGSGNVIHSTSSLERTIAWNGNHIGDNCELQDALLMNRSVLARGVLIQEGAVIGNDCEIGSKAVIKQQVKLWPGKSVPSHATVDASIIWGDTVAKPLFSSKGMIGIPNADIQPERITKLAAAYGSTLRQDAVVLLSSCTHPYANLLKEAMMVGLRSVGVHITDLGTSSAEATRYAVRRSKAQGAVHIRLLQQASLANVMLEWIDHQGLPLSKSTERKIEQTYAQEDFIRCTADRTGTHRIDQHSDADYIQALSRHVDFALIRQQHFKYVLLTAPTVGSDFIQRWSSLIGGTRILVQQWHDLAPLHTEQVKLNGADLGIHLDDEGNAALISPKGIIVRDQMLTALAAIALDHAGSRAVMGVPASANGLYALRPKHTNLRIVFTKESLRSVMEATVGLPFSPAASRTYAISIILQHLASQQTTLDYMLEQLPTTFTAREEVTCQWNQKGILMRQLMEWIRTSGLEVNLLDGIRVETGEGSVHILPHQDEPIFQIFAEAHSLTQAKILAHNYASRITQTHHEIKH